MTLQKTFDELPHGGSSWGMWDTKDLKDELGTLNRLTVEVKAAAGKEIKEGISVSLK